MKKRIVIIFFILSCTVISYAELLNGSISLNQCHEIAKTKYPLTRQKIIAAEISSLKKSNYNKNWLPQLSLGAQASYQSDVSELPIKFPNIPGFKIETPETPDKDKYQITLDIKQTIYDGNLTNSLINQEIAGFKADSSKIETELFKLKESINNIYFSALLLFERSNILQISKSDLSAKLVSLESGVKNGIILPMQYDILKAEVLNLDQQITENRNNYRTTLQILEIYLDQPIAVDVVLVEPVVNAILEFSSPQNRPEYAQFKLEELSIQSAKSVIDSKVKPKLYAYGQLGYAKPGLDMFKNEFQPYAVGGLKAVWEIGSYYTYSSEKEIINQSRSIVKSRQETFDKNLAVILKKSFSEISNQQELLIKDEELVQLHENIVKSAASQLTNGVINSTDYLKYANALSLAKQNKKAHEIQLIQAKINYLTMRGDL